MKPTINLTTFPVVFTFLMILTLTHVTFSQGNSNGNANSNNNSNGNALKWETQGNSADTSDFIGTTNPTALKMRTNNVERLRITKDGKFGIGISNPLEKFELQGNLKLSGDIIFSDYADVNDTTDKFLFVDNQGRTNTKTKSQIKSLIYEVDCYIPSDPYLNPSLKSTGDTLGVTLPSWANTTNGTKNILYTGTGCPAWVGIGTDNPLTILDVHGDVRADEGIALGDLSVPQAGIHVRNYTQDHIKSFDKLLLIEKNADHTLLQLENNGLLRARRIKIDQQPWSDYVFDVDYELMPLDELQYFIQTNGHLPEVPTTEEVQENGVDLAETNALLLKKIEELTLYLLDQKAETEELRKELEELKTLVNQQ